MTPPRRTSITVALAALVVTGTGIAWASGITLTSSKLGASALTTPAMFPVSVTLANKAGQPVGKVNNGDIITFVWSQPVDLPTLCSGWSNASPPTKAINYKWSVTSNATGNDTFAPSGTAAPCSSGLHVGSVDLGATGYNTNATQTIDFTATNDLSFSGSTTVLTVTLAGIKNGGNAGTVTSGAAATWTCDSNLTDRATPARGCGNNLAESTTTVQF